jgi:hypothetical protein
MTRPASSPRRQREDEQRRLLGRAFLTAALIALPIAFVLMFVVDSGSPQGRGPETGAADLLRPLLAIGFLLIGATFAVVIGALTAAIVWLALKFERAWLGFVLTLLVASGLALMDEDRSWSRLLQIVFLWCIPATVSVWLHGSLQPRLERS